MDDFRHDKEEHWMSVSDLMSVLMILFLLIAVLKIKMVSEIESENSKLYNYDKIKQEISKFIYKEDKLYKALQKEFSEDFEKWSAELNRDNLTISFTDENIMFKSGSSNLTNRYKLILQDFFPRYIKVLRRHKEVINEVRLEGHTSSDWNKSSSYKDAYFKNMKLSQDRTRTVLEYSMSLPEIDKKGWEWTKSYITANGLSSSKLKTRRILDEQVEDAVRSRRVEFKILTKTKELVNKIKKISKN